MEPTTKNLKVFGYGLGVILTFFGTIRTIHHGLSWIEIVLFTFAVIFVIWTSVNLNSLIPVYRGWMKVVHPIGVVITGILISLVFYFVFTPIGLIMRIFGKDLLNRKLEPEAKSYWHYREPEEFDKERYTKQF